jgi:hypothetical protein
MSGATLERRLANYRAAIRAAADGDAPAAAREPGDRGDGGVVRGSIELGRRLAEALDGELVLEPGGPVVIVEPATVVLPLDRARLAGLPGMPPADAPLVCIDTETTGLATASGTVAFLVGLGWWDGDRFRQVQLLLPDHPAERGLLARLAAHIPADSWLVSYNGRGFDWPLLVARYRMSGVAAPAHAGHLDLLPFVRRVYRHRMSDARLRTVETDLLGTIRHGDVDGWQIPGLFLDFLRGGDAWPLIDVVRHNREDVRSLGRLLERIDGSFGDPAARRSQPLGDLAGLSRAFRRGGRLDDALACLDAALDCVGRAGRGDPSATSPDDDPAGLPWWHPKRPADVGGAAPRASWQRLVDGRLESPWTAERVAIERARLLRRLGRFDDAAAAWLELASGRGAIAVQAWIEIAKLREHRLGDPDGALDAADRAARLAETRRRIGLGDPATERALRARLDRLRRRVAAATASPSAGRQAATRSNAIATEPPPPRQSVASP